MASPSDSSGLKPDEMSEGDDLFASLREREAKLPSSTCNQKIHSTCTKDLQACQAMSARRRSLISLAVLLVVGTALLILTRRGLSGVTAAALWGALGWAIVQTVILFLGFARQQSGSSTRVRLGMTVLVPLLFFGYLTLIRTSSPPLGEFIAHSENTGHALHCGLFSFVIGAFAACGILFLWRKTDPFTPRLSGSLAGLLGGLGAATPIGLVCPGTDCWHLWLAHGLSLVVGGWNGGHAGKALAVALRSRRDSLCRARCT
jgi:hypothetical protein